MQAGHDTVYVVDDDPEMRESMVEALKPGDLPVESYASADEFLAEFDPDRAGCAVFDVCMPGMSGLDLCERVLNDHPGLPVIIVSSQGDVSRTRRCFKLGAVDFIEKPIASAEFLALVQQTMDEGAVAQRRQEQRAKVIQRIESLSDRERQILDMITDGVLNKQMAMRLDLHSRTIEFHRQKIMRKMSCDSVADLVRMVVESKVDGVR